MNGEFDEKAVTDNWTVTVGGSDDLGSPGEGSRGVVVVDYVVRRMTIPTGIVLPEFRARFEDAVPHLPLTQVRELVSRGAPWGEMVDLVGRAEIGRAHV